VDSRKLLLNLKNGGIGWNLVINKHCSEQRKATVVKFIDLAAISATIFQEFQHLAEVP